MDGKDHGFLTREDFKQSLIRRGHIFNLSQVQTSIDDIVAQLEFD